MTSTNDILNAFNADGKATKVETPSTFKNNPTVFISNQDADNIGAYFVGTFLLGKSVPKKDDPTKFNFYLECRLEKTTASSITASDGKGTYKPVEVKEGDIVSIFAPSRLFRAVSTLSPGTKFVAVYEGMRKPKDSGKKAGMAHHFAVQSKPGALTVEDVDYIKNRTKPTDTKPVVSKEEVSKASEADQAEALKLLED